LLARLQRQARQRRIDAQQRMLHRRLIERVGAGELGPRHIEGAVAQLRRPATYALSASLGFTVTRAK
jgi:hypothetical protein